MYYKPHILQVRRHDQARDEYGRLLEDKDRWVDVCPCRCDDNTTQEFRGENAIIYRPKYHIVCEGHIEVYEGDEIRCVPFASEDNNKFAFAFGEQSFNEVTTSSNTERCRGVVYMVKQYNFYNYTEVWV